MYVTLSNDKIVEIEDRLVVARGSGWEDDEKDSRREMFVMMEQFGVLW